MGRHCAKDYWLTEITKTGDDACRNLAPELDEMTDGRQTYNAVFGFIPQAAPPRPRNASIASLMKLYSTRRSGRKEAARREIQLRFNYLDYSVQKKILWLFLDGSKQDRMFCFKQLKHSWNRVFEPKIVELWEMYREPECAELLVKYGNIDYVRHHQEDMAQDAGYYLVCKRLALEDRSYVIERDRLEGPEAYVRLLYETERTIGADEAMSVLWRVIDLSLLQCICHRCIIAPYFLVYDGQVDSDDRPIVTIVPSIVWNDLVMECMRYLYHIAPKAVVAEALRLDMDVRKLYHRLVGGRCYCNSGDPIADKCRDLRMFCKLAYAMFPEDKRKYADENDRELSNSSASASAADYCPEADADKSEWRSIADRSTKNLLENIRTYRLAEDMTPEQWRALYVEKSLPKDKAFKTLSERLGLAPDCPDRDEFIKQLLSWIPA